MPDKPGQSCCNKSDCTPAEAKQKDGQWYARKLGETVWHRVPPEKIEQNRDSPDGRNHICSPPFAPSNIYCFIAGSGI